MCPEKGFWRPRRGQSQAGHLASSAATPKPSACSPPRTPGSAPGTALSMGRHPHGRASYPEGTQAGGKGGLGSPRLYRGEGSSSVTPQSPPVPAHPLPSQLLLGAGLWAGTARPQGRGPHVAVWQGAPQAASCLQGCVGLTGDGSRGVQPSLPRQHLQTVPGPSPERSREWDIPVVTTPCRPSVPGGKGCSLCCP